MKKQETFVERVLTFLKGDSEKAKVERFQRRTVKSINNSIKVHENELDDLKDKLIDAEEILENVIEQIDVTRLNSTESIDAYAIEYLSAIKAAENKINSIKEAIEDKKALIVEGKRFIEILK